MRIFAFFVTGWDKQMHQDPTVTRVLAWTRGVWEQTESNIVILSCCDGDCFTLWNFSSVWSNICSNKKNRQTWSLARKDIAEPAHHLHSEHTLLPSGRSEKDPIKCRNRYLNGYKKGFHSSQSIC